MKCQLLIQRFNLKKQKYPISVGYMGRKRAVDFNDTTLETWKRVIPSHCYILRSHEKEIIIDETVKISYGGFDNEINVQKFQSAEFGYFFIDQAEEVSRDDVALLQGTMRLKINDEELDYKGLFTANPSDCWLVDDFIYTEKNSHSFIQALPSDNPYLPEGYIDDLKEAFAHRPELIEAYVYGSWSSLSGFDLVINKTWIESAVNRDLSFVKSGRKVVACDPARFGDDETVIYVIEDNKIVDQMIYGQKSTMETAGYLVALKNKHKARYVAVDATGLGAGIVDRLRELKIPTLEINSGSRPTVETQQNTYLNLRSQMWWEAADLFAKEQVNIPNDSVLKRQLGSVKYQMNSRGLIQIESKDDIKKRLGGKSPDRADAYVLGLYALKYVTPDKHDFRRGIVRKKVDNKYGWQYHEGPMARIR